MKQIAIISGKGGTGKTSLAACLAVMARHSVIVDADVDAADLALLLHPQVTEQVEFKGGKMARIDQEKCIECGKCSEVCRPRAISPDFTVSPIYCDGCTACIRVCPVDAVTLEEKVRGAHYLAETHYGKMLYARLNPGEGNTGLLVTTLRNRAEDLAFAEDTELIIIDGPPGSGCPAIAAVSGVDLVLIVTEPTLSGISDLERVGELLAMLQLKAILCINKYDLNLENTKAIRNYCEQKGIELMGELPFDHVFTRAIVQGKPLLECGDGRTVCEVEEMLARLLAMCE